MNTIVSINIIAWFASLFSDPLSTGEVTVLQEPSAAYCDELPTSNAQYNLAEEAEEFPAAQCGRYRVSCDNVDDKEFYAVIVPAVPPELRGTVISFGGERGGGLNSEMIANYGNMGFRTVMIAHKLASGNDSWSCAQTNCPEFNTVSEPGPKQAACRSATIITYFKHEFDPQDELPYCAQGHSAGSSQVLYSLVHYGVDDVLDYVQLTGSTPFARSDYGCDYRLFNGTGHRQYTGANPGGGTQTVLYRPFNYDETANFARILMDDSFGLHANECGDNPTNGVSDPARIRLEEQSIVSEGADYLMPDTVVDWFNCAASSNITDGMGGFLLDELNSANGAGTRIFMQTIRPGSGATKDCEGERPWWKSNGQPSSIQTLMTGRMNSQCVKQE